MSLNTESNTNSITDENIKIEEIESDIPTVHPESPIAHSPTGNVTGGDITNHFDAEVDTKQETADPELFKHEVHDESLTMQE